MIIFTSIIACEKKTISTSPSVKDTENSGGGSSGGEVSTTGTVKIMASWTSKFIYCNPAYTVVIGLGYSSTDVANDAYFAQTSSQGSSLTYTKDNLTAGTYYYKAKKTYKISTCGNPQGGAPSDVTKLGAFTIIAGQTTTINVGSLN